MFDMVIRGLKIFYVILEAPKSIMTQLAIPCSKLTIETLEQGMKYVQS